MFLFEILIWIRRE